MKDVRPIPARIGQMSRPGSKVLDERIDQQRRAHPPGPLPLSGYPTDPLPEHILEAVSRAARDNHIAPSAGTLELRQAVAEKLARGNGIAADPETDILITHGAMHAVHLLLQVLLEAGDEVLMFSPTYFFGGLIQLVRGIPVYAPLSERDGYRFRREAIEEKLTPRSRVILMNCPCNPTGHVAAIDELKHIAEFADRHDLLIISDESYEQFVYDGRRSVSIASLEAARRRTVTIQSFTKSYGMPGWRIGYIAGPDRIVAAARKVLEWTGLMCNHPAQAAAAAALTGPNQWFADIVRRFERNRDTLFNAIKRIPAVHALVPASTPFALLDLLDAGQSPEAVSRRLLDEFGIPSVSGEAFQAPRAIRIPFGGAEAAVEEAATRLVRAFS